VALLLWYKLNDKAASTSVADSSGNGYTGTATRNTNLDSVAGKINNAYDSNNSNNNISTTLTPPAAGTIAVWFYLDVVMNNRSIIYSQNAVGRCYMVVNQSDHLCAGIGSQGYTTIYGGDALVASTWYHGAISWSAADGVRLYLNGTQIYSGAMAGNPSTAAFCLLNFPGYITGIKGRLDNARIYNQVLPAWQIAALYNFGKGSEDAEPWQGEITIRSTMRRALRPILAGAA
jgi:hypothetical protein